MGTTPSRRRTAVLVRVVAGLTLLPLILSVITPWHGSISTTAVTTASYARWSPFQSAVVISAGALYLGYWLRIWPHEHATRAAAAYLAALSTLAIVDEAVFRSINLWLYAVIVVGVVLRPRLAVPAVLLIAAVTTLVTLDPPGPGTGTGQTGTVSRLGSTPLPLPGLPVWLSVQLAAATVAALPVLIAGLGTTMVSSLNRANRQLRDARALQVQMAAQQERARVARDLHDTLGHSLSLMAVKLQVAEHLAAVGDHDAVAEVSEVRRLTLQALGEVRDTVSGYRQPTINAELTGARIALEASGITLHLRDHHGALIPQVEATCGWIIREATTNVIRHSRARNCHISLERDAGNITVSVADDGPTGHHNGSGTGLHGLGERVHALGGLLTAGPAAPSPGFRFSARIPLDPEIRHDTD
jgi:two-component system sensor histidine kinase DesK